MLPDRKILVKGGPKLYKTAPRLKGFAALRASLARLHHRAVGLAKKPHADAAKAADLAIDLQAALRRAYQADE